MENYILVNSNKEQKCNLRTGEGNDRNSSLKPRYSVLLFRHDDFEFIICPLILQTKLHPCGQVCKGLTV